MGLRVWPYAVAVAVVTVLAGCAEDDPGPTAAQASETLKSQIDSVMRESAALANIRIIDPGQKDIPCGDEKVKRRYAATAEFHPEDQGLVDQLAGALLGQGYKVSEVDAPNSQRTVLRLPTARTVVTLDVPTPGTVTVVGETDCVAAR